MSLYGWLSLVAAGFALAVTGFGVFAAWMSLGKGHPAFRAALKRWTVFDYAICVVFAIGTLFLLADLIGVLRDKEAYPYWHYGYLLSGFVYNTLAGLFLFVRLGITLRPPVADDHENEPDQAESAEERV